MFLNKLRSLFRKKDGELELKARIKVLEDLIQSLGQRAWTINIENISIENLRLDKLEFYLEKIDVDDLSGILNVGLNTLTEAEKVATRKPLGAYLTKQIGK